MEKAHIINKQIKIKLLRNNKRISVIKEDNH